MKRWQSEASLWTITTVSITDSTASLLKTLMIGVFPLAYLGIGVVVILKRRREQNEAS